MKEATGELNMSVFVIISIGVLSAFFYTVIWPGMQSNMNRNTKCNKAVDCKESDNQDGTSVCQYYENDVLVEADIICTWKG